MDGSDRNMVKDQIKAEKGRDTGRNKWRETVNREIESQRMRQKADRERCKLKTTLSCTFEDLSSVTANMVHIGGSHVTV